MSLYRNARLGATLHGRLAGSPTSIMRQALAPRAIHITSIRLKEKSINIGNPYFGPYYEDKLAPPRWKHHWLLMMRRKAEIEGEEPPHPRSDQVNWNYDAELQAFSYRLHIKVPLDVLRAAFCEPMPEPTSDNLLTNNEPLVTAGEIFMLEFLSLYFETVFPNLPKDCVKACTDYLISEAILADTAENLGYTDLIQSPVFPVGPRSLMRCFLATIAAIITGPGGRLEAAKFVQDFVVTRIISKDIVHDLWRPQNPMGLLADELRSRGLLQPEVRLLRQSGSSTVMPIYFVGIFCDKKLIAESGAETTIKAETDAARVALKKLYGVSADQYMPNFKVLKDVTFVKRVEDLACHVDFNLHPQEEQDKVKHEGEEDKIETKKKGLMSWPF